MIVLFIIIAFAVICIIVGQIGAHRNKTTIPKNDIAAQKRHLEWSSQNGQRISEYNRLEEPSRSEEDKLDINSHKTFVTQNERSKFYTQQIICSKDNDCDQVNSKEKFDLRNVPSESTNNPIIGNYTSGYLRLDGKEDKPIGISNYMCQDFELTLSTWEEICSKNGINPLDELITEVYFEVKGLYYQDNEAIEAARKLSKGNNLYLEPEPNNSHDKYALKIFTENHVFIGYVDKSCSKIFTERSNDFISCKIQKVKKSYDIPYVHVVAKYKGAFDVYGEYVESVISRVHNYIKPAMRLKDKEEFEKAADKFIYAGKHEVFKNFQVEAYRKACLCLRKIKDYNREVEIINIILEQYSNELHDNQKDTLKKRLEVATRLKESAEKRKIRLNKKLES